MTETNKTLKIKRPPGRPKERKNAKRRSLYLEDDLWRKLEFCSFFQKQPICRIIEQASIMYLNDQEFFKHIDWDGDQNQLLNI